MSLQYDLKHLKRYPYHMPGHKRNEKFGITGAEIDITEIEGYDNLHSAEGSIKDIENKLQSIYKSKKSFISVGGSTLGILAAVFAVCEKGDTIILARNCHKSVCNACRLLELRPVFIEPEFDYDNGYYTRMEQSTVHSAVAANPDAKAVIITSPTYEGYISEISADIPLIIDSAHGAHLGIGYFPKYAKGDIVVSSLHKTLPALTQTGVINVYNESYINRVKQYLDIFETSSPSYVLMNSIDICCDYIINKRQEFCTYYTRLCDFRCMETEHLKLKYNDDISKIVISTHHCDITAPSLAKLLRIKYCIEPEMVSDNYILLMSTIADSEEALNRLKEILLEIDDELEDRFQLIKRKPPVTEGSEVIKIDDKAEETVLSKAAGKISNEFVYAYPPDIPILIPNRIISQSAIDYITHAMHMGVNILSDSGLLPNKILTKRDI